MTTPILQVLDLPSVGPWPTLDPFLFCVHHNDQYPAGQANGGPKASLVGRNMGQDFANIDGWNMYHGDIVPGFPRHPHRGFETITFVRQGIIDHADSMGAAARYGDGDVQWLTAGDGINHAEMFPLLNQGGSNPLDFFQIWLNLPARSKRAAPYFSMFWDATVPKQTFRDKMNRQSEITIVAGTHFGPSPPKAPPNSWAHAPENRVGVARIEMSPHAELELPMGSGGMNRALYVATGSIDCGGKTDLKRMQLVLRPDSETVVKAGLSGAMLLLLEGMPIGEPIVKYGPFVMNTQQEIAQAFSDYRRTGFGGWPWKSSEPTHGNERKKFARHADGREESPT